MLLYRWGGATVFASYSKRKSSRVIEACGVTVNDLTGHGECLERARPDPFQINQVLEFFDIVVVGEIEHGGEAIHIDVLFPHVMSIRELRLTNGFSNDLWPLFCQVDHV